ncbi:hypothetical protein [Streptomyces hesseae]|uniref:Uncharacterized protein n=1 Tax=Streptomyces hesseae TaxID=3075519 RepID=A0ABU2SH59_9ACTN|nr:hypothetical protein [Streptomyces sp. DSM 40473]MDT0448313.1 hypothetical protein [Streptomyces sp. DSM 40473]
METTERCPHCSGKLRQDVAGVLGSLAATAASEVATPFKAFTNAVKDIQASRGRSRVLGWFRCVSCGKKSGVCPKCTRAFHLSVTKRNTLVDCPRCGADLYI